MQFVAGDLSPATIAGIGFARKAFEQNGSRILVFEDQSYDVVRQGAIILKWFGLSVTAKPRFFQAYSYPASVKNAIRNLEWSRNAKFEPGEWKYAWLMRGEWSTKPCLDKIDDLVFQFGAYETWSVLTSLPALERRVRGYEFIKALLKARKAYFTNEKRIDIPVMVKVPYIYLGTFVCRTFRDSDGKLCIRQPRNWRGDLLKGGILEEIKTVADLVSGHRFHTGNFDFSFVRYSRNSSRARSCRGI